MELLKTIRKQLGMTQAELGAELGVTQGSISFYENGTVIPPDVAGKLIGLARSRGIAASFDALYAPALLPDHPAPEPTAAQGA